MLTLCKDEQGRTWVGTYSDGLGYLDAAGIFHPVDLGISNSIGIFGINQDPQGNLWIGTMGAGIFCLGKDGSRKNYRAKYGTENNLKANCLPNDYTSRLSFSKDGNLFAVLAKGEDGSLVQKMSLYGTGSYIK